ncbi:hypothetical protein [Vibrio europaeus]|uniref:hypothetical protein n=1 Tax=Vibrio europaeus TaxID=300876 RepID=UPI00233E85EB|nr:hypothetical protein [Vibrio europaeus]MDC5753616.1 hypothetical protein [Vibrio europaeus]MDC5816577.1 hypothetical protein [Vibrio europaeus]
MKQNSPFTPGGRLPGASLTSALQAAKKPEEDNTIAENLLLASVEDDVVLAALSDLSEKQMRSLAASIAVEFARSEDHTYNDLEAIVIGSIDDVDNDEEPELDEEEQKEFNELISLVGDALVAFSGKDIKMVQKALEKEDDELLDSIAAEIVEKIKGESTSELVADFSVKEALLLSATKKVIRNGELKLVKTNRKKRKMSAAQKQALKKARKKSNSAAARAKRKKSNRKRAQRGM